MKQDDDDEEFDLELEETELAYGDTSDTEKEYAAVTSNPLTPTFNQTSTTATDATADDNSANYIDTSNPILHPDVVPPKYETVDQIKYKINQEIQERTHSPALGPEFIIYAHGDTVGC